VCVVCVWCVGVGCVWGVCVYVVCVGVCVCVCVCVCGACVVEYDHVQQNHQTYNE